MSNREHYKTEVISAASNTYIRWPLVIAFAIILIGFNALGSEIKRLFSATILGTSDASNTALMSNNAISKKLYILSHIPRSPDVTSGAIAGRITVLDIESRQELYTFAAGVNVDAVPSPDGTKLYIASVDSSPDGGIGIDYLTAIDIKTEKELWHLILDDRMKGEIPTTLAISPDGRWLYYYSYPWLRLNEYPVDEVPYWVTIVNTSTGQALPDKILLPDCFTGTFQVDPNGKFLYITCLGTQDIRIANLDTFQVEQRLKIPETPNRSALSWKVGGIASSILSSDGRIMYVVTNDLHVTVIDVVQRAIKKTINLDPSRKWLAINSMTFLSSDDQILSIGVQARKSRNENTTNIVSFRTIDWRENSNVTFKTSFIGGVHASLHSNGLIYAVVVPAFPNASNTIIQIDADGNQDGAPIIRQGEDIKRIFTGP